jgi:hypothetical protein
VIAVELENRVSTFILMCQFYISNLHVCRYLYNNEFTGPIPESWKNMENLRDLYVMRVSARFLVLVPVSRLKRLVTLMHVVLHFAGG